MNDRKVFRAATAGWLAASLAVLVGGRAAGDVLLEGFEGAKKYSTTGKTAVVTAADAVTEGANALQLDAGAAVIVNVPARAAPVPGWLKIDTFQSQPVVSAMHLSLGHRRGYVRPGKDVLAVPVALASRASLNAWPPSALKLTIRNASTHSIVVDNIRLVPPAKLPPGVVLLDFGPAKQVVWPGFEPAGVVGTGIAWKVGPTESHSVAHLDPLLGDFSGRRLLYKALESLQIQARKQAGTAWVWLTHYGYQYSPAVEYMARINGRPLLRHRVPAGRILTLDTLLSGRGEAWTSDWLERTFVPRLVRRAECPLKVGQNELELGNCQVAAAIIADRKDVSAAQAYIRQLDEDLKRYRRQFLLATRADARCDVAPTEAEAKAGMMVFRPPPEDWFGRSVVPKGENRSGAIKLAAASGSMATAAFLVAPTVDATMLQATAGALHSPTAALPAGSCRIQAVAALPVVREGCVYDQPFTVAANFRRVRARQLCWFILQVKVPAHQASGTYKGPIRISHGRGRAALPLEVTVAALPKVRQLPTATFAIGTSVGCFEVYRFLRETLREPDRLRATRQIGSLLFAGGFNASAVNGPSFRRGKLLTSPFSQALQRRLYIEGDGKTLVYLVPGLRSLGELQPGTDKYRAEVEKLVKAVADEAGKHRLGSYYIHCGRINGAEGATIIQRAASVRRVGGKPAVAASAAGLSGMDRNQRNRLFADLDTLLMYSGPGAAAVGKDFKSIGNDRTLLVAADEPDPFTCGFYTWAVGAHGAVVQRAFSYRPAYDGFFFDGRSLLLPTATVGGFEPALPMLLLAQGRADYELGRRCDALLASAGRKNVSAAGLKSVLDEIRSECDRRPPRYDHTRLRSTSVPHAKVLEWRRRLVVEAGKVVRAMAAPALPAPSSRGPTSPPGP